MAPASVPGATVNVLPNFTVPEIVGTGADGINGSVTASWRESHRARGRSDQTSTSGVKMSTPMLSPTHQVHQLNSRLSEGIRPRQWSRPTPQLELIRQATGPPIISSGTMSSS